MLHKLTESQSRNCVLRGKYHRKSQGTLYSTLRYTLNIKCFEPDFLTICSCILLHAFRISSQKQKDITGYTLSTWRNLKVITSPYEKWRQRIFLKFHLLNQMLFPDCFLLRHFEESSQKRSRLFWLRYLIQNWKRVKSVHPIPRLIEAP